MNESLPSRLGSGLHRLLFGVGVLAALVAANTLYLLFVRAGVFLGWKRAAGSHVFQVLLLGHTVLGILLVAIVLMFALRHLPRVWNRRGIATLGTGLLTVAICTVLLLTGLFILTEAASRSHRWIWWVHVVAAGLSPVVYMLHRRASVVRSLPATGRRLIRGMVITLLLFGSSHAVSAMLRPAAEPAANQVPSIAYAIERYGMVPPGFADPPSPFYPSPGRTSTGRHVSSEAILGSAPPPEDFVRREVMETGIYASSGIGSESCVRCHPDVTAQWTASAHRFSSFNNPFYEAAINLLRTAGKESNWWLEVHREISGSQATVGEMKSRWCGACHDPALLFTGELDSKVDRSSVNAQAGLTCLACHAIESTHDRTGNGNYTLRATGGDPYLFAGVETSGPRRTLHDAALRARPDAHRVAMLPDILKQPDVCTACHKVSLREPLNSYRWLRGQNEPDSWEDSGVSLENAGTFYLPEARRICQDCHMPFEPAPDGDMAAENGMVRSHRFLAANTALPFIRGDTASWRRTEDFLRDEKLTVDIFAVSADADGSRDGLLDGPVVVMAGSQAVFDIVVRNRGVGHAFPGGTIDSNQAWLEVSLFDSENRLLVASGGLDAAGVLDSDAHVFGAMFVDSTGAVIDRRNPQDQRATVFKNVVGPGSADVAHYRLSLPSRPGRYELRARLLWRKFNRGYSVFVHAAVPEAFPGAQEAPRLPVTVIASDSIALDVLGEPEFRTSDRLTRQSDAWERYNDFGIASLREGRTARAMQAFGTVSSLAPEQFDGPLNMARTALAEGDVETALIHLDEAERRIPGDSRVAWVWGQAWLADGQYDRASSAYRRVLSAFPRHRASLMGLGRSLYLDGEFDAALQVLGELLNIDPEHRGGSYHRMLVLRALGRDEDAALAGAMVEYLQVDESSRRWTQTVRLANPGVNRMAQPVRTYDLIAVDTK